MASGDKRKLRGAIYTRKSTEEGLDQAFNSLDAQREACAAYIMSQQHEGWVMIQDRYDDGGYSGGTIERPAIQQLLADVKAGKVSGSPERPSQRQKQARRSDPLRAHPLGWPVPVHRRWPHRPRLQYRRTVDQAAGPESQECAIRRLRRRR
jgi:hypothetical protein